MLSTKLLFERMFLGSTSTASIASTASTADADKTAKDAGSINHADITYSPADLISNGHYGNVYKARYKQSNVALKKTGYHFSKDKKIVDNEVNILSHVMRLDAPYIIKYLGHYYQPDYAYIVFEYMPKGDMLKCFENELRWNWSKRYAVMMPLTEAVAYLHQHNILHCDIKSANVLVDENDKIKLGDFGFSRVIDDVPRNTVEGTLGYLAPEIRKSYRPFRPLLPPYTTKSDNYSLATVFWDIATWGQEALAKDMDDSNTLLTIPAGCPRALGSIILWGRDSDPKNRFDAEEIIEVLDGESSKLKC